MSQCHQIILNLEKDADEKFENFNAKDQPQLGMHSKYCIYNDIKRVCKIFQKTQIKEYKNEITFLCLANKYGINVPKLIDAWLYENDVYIIMENIIGNTLEDLIKHGNDNVLTKENIENLLKMVTKMNNVGIFHNDLSDSNIVWDSQSKSFNIIDFEDATETPNSKQNDFEYLMKSILDNDNEQYKKTVIGWIQKYILVHKGGGGGGGNIQKQKTFDMKLMLVTLACMFFL